MAVILYASIFAEGDRFYYFGWRTLAGVPVVCDPFNSFPEYGRECRDWQAEIDAKYASR